MSIKNYFALAILGVIAWFAYGKYEEKQAQTTKLVKDYNLSDVQLAAYKVCDRQMSGKQLDPKNPDIKVVNGSVPASICACQAKQMAKVMLPGEYSSHKRVIDSMTEGERDTSTELKASQLNTGYSPSSGFSSLHRSLLGCISHYRVERAAQKKERIRQICSSKNARDTHLCRS